MNDRSNWSFVKLTPLIGPAGAAVLLLAGLVIALYSERSYQSQRIAEVEVEARILASTVTAALDFDDPGAAQEYVNALRVNAQIDVVAVYDSKGALFANFVRGDQEPLPTTAPPPGTHLEQGRLIATIPIVEDGRRLGMVYLRAVAEPLATRLERYGVFGLLVLLTLLVVIVFAIAQSALKRANDELALRASALADANNELQSQIVQREKAEETLRQVQKMEAIGQITGGVAHDFNNLLQIILGNLSVAQNRLESGKATPENLRQYIERATHGGQRAATLTKQLLAFSRRQPLEPKPIDVNKLTSGMSQLLHRTLGESIQIETVLSGGAWRASADANQLENALLNLAVNARDAMPRGGKLTIETANAFLDESYASLHDGMKPGPYVSIAVTDTGAGMTKEVMEKAFDPFFTTKDIGHGTGLGLSQVYGFIKQSGGHVAIYSEVGQGTTVKLYLPRIIGELHEDESSEHAAHAHDGPIHDLILVVEDDPDVRTFTVETLRYLGYRVIEAENGRAALRLLEVTSGVQLLFTDVGLPGGLNGRQLADEVHARWPHLKVLYTTGYARNAIVHNGMLDPGVELITKPFTAAELGRKMRSILSIDSES